MSANTPKRSFDDYADFNASTQESSSAASSKKARPDAPEPHLWGSQLWEMIVKLPQDTTNAILYNACQNDAVASATVQAANRERLASIAATPPVNFDHYSSSCWYTLNKKYARLSGSKQYDAVADIESELSDARDAILQAANVPDARWETRRNALEVCRKIAKSVMLCEEMQIRHELMKDSVELTAWADAMAEIARGMSEQERDRYKAEGLYEKLVDLQTECDWESEMEGLRELYEIFDGEIGEDEDDEDEDDDEDEGDEEALEEDNAREAPQSSYAMRTMPHPLPTAPAAPSEVPPRRTSVFNISDMV